MSYDRAAAWVKLRNRLTGDTPLVTALGGAKVFWQVAPKGTALPYITLNTAVMLSDDAFNTETTKFVFDVHIWTDLRVAGCGDLRSQLMGLVNGDWAAQSSGGATYGYHRWEPGEISTTGWYMTTCLRVDERDLSDQASAEGHDFLSFVLWISKIRA